MLASAGVTGIVPSWLRPNPLGSSHTIVGAAWSTARALPRRVVEDVRMTVPSQEQAALDVTRASRLYRRIWRCCFIAGAVGLAALAPLIAAMQIELVAMSGAATNSGIADFVKRGVIPATVV